MKPRENPFRSECIDAIRCRLPEMAWPELLARWERLGRQAAIVGPHGSGKTTLQRRFAQYFTEQSIPVAWLRLHRESRGDASRQIDLLCRNLRPESIVFVDGAEQLGPIAWRRFLHRIRRAAGLLITVHRPGRLPTLVDRRPTPELLRELVIELLGDERRADACSLDRLFHAHGGNIRLCFRELYDRFSDERLRSI